MTNVRWKVLFLVAAGTALMFMDQVNISAAAPAIMKDLNLNATQMGMIFSFFMATVALSSVPVGIYIDRIGVKQGWARVLGFWSFATMLTALTQGFASLAILRMMVGCFASGDFPSQARAVAEWFPSKERGRALGIALAISRFGLIFGIPLAAFLTARYGWRMMFVITGLITLVWLPFWLWYFEKPEKHPSVSEEECQYIKAGQPKPQSGVVVERMSIVTMLRYRSVWGIVIGYFCYGYAFITLSSWIPGYLVMERGFSMMKMGWASSIIFAAGFLGILIGGTASDYLMRLGYNATSARKTLINIGLILGVSVILAAYARDAVTAVIFLAIAQGGLSLATANLWVVTTELAPPGSVASLAALQNGASTAAGVVGPTLTGYIVTTTGSFTLGLVLIGVVLLLAAFSYTFIVGKVRPLEQTSEIAS